MFGDMFGLFRPRLVTTGYNHKIRRRFSIKDLHNRLYYRVKFPRENDIRIDKSTLLKYSQIAVTGKNNQIIIEEGCKIYGIEIYIRGDNNKLFIGKDTNVNQSSLGAVFSVSLKGDGNEIGIGARAQIRGRADITAHGGTRIIIGDDFGMTADTEIRSGDGHKMINMDGEVYNKPQDIHIGNNCWLGMRGTIQKGVTLQNDTIVAKNSIVTKSFDRDHIMIGGIPARIIKTDVTWKF